MAQHRCDVLAELRSEPLPHLHPTRGLETERANCCTAGEPLGVSAPISIQGRLRRILTSIKREPFHTVRLLTCDGGALRMPRAGKLHAGAGSGCPSTPPSSSASIWLRMRGGASSQRPNKLVVSFDLPAAVFGEVRFA